LRRSRFSIAVLFIALASAGVYFGKLRRTEHLPEPQTSFPISATQKSPIPFVSPVSQTSPSPNPQSNPGNSSSHSDQEEIQETRRGYALARKFERSLTREAVHKITEGFPRSFFRRAGFYSTQNPLRGLCTREEYEKLRQRIPLQELHERGGYVSHLVLLYDDLNQREYISRIRKTWLGQAHLIELRVLDAYYREVSENSVLSPPREETQEKIERGEQKLIESGIAPEHVADYVLGTAMKSPKCLGKLNMELTQWIRQDLTRDRGKIVAARIERFWQSKRKLPSDLEELFPEEIDEKHSRKTYLDGWSLPYLVRTNIAGRMEVYSSGEDAKNGTLDDIIVGSFASR
jgi:hypothetical protein